MQFGGVFAGCFTAIFANVHKPESATTLAVHKFFGSDSDTQQALQYLLWLLLGDATHHSFAFLCCITQGSQGKCSHIFAIVVGIFMVNFAYANTAL